MHGEDVIGFDKVIFHLIAADELLRAIRFFDRGAVAILQGPASYGLGVLHALLQDLLTINVGQRIVGGRGEDGAAGLVKLGF
jgi:hypothetical protein